MSEKTNISWADSTINFWSGCTKVSPGCKNCYAETRDARMMQEKVIHWGKGAPRLKHSGAVKNALALNRKPWICDLCGHASAANRRDSGSCLNSNCDYHTKGAHGSFHRRRIFSLSLGDWLDEEVPIEWLAEMLDTIRRCDLCDWLLLTKRPENWRIRLEAVAALEHKASDLPEAFFEWLDGWLEDWPDRLSPPHNIWIGTSVENQAMADLRIQQLLKIPARVRFLSVEPMLEAIDLGLGEINYDRNLNGPASTKPAIDWTIFGGESGSGARPFHEENAVGGIAQCRAAGVAAFFKQYGSNAYRNGERLIFKDPKGGDMSEWPAALRIREFPAIQQP